jgi:hypothetical protein
MIHEVERPFVEGEEVPPELVVALLPARTDTRYFHLVFSDRVEMCGTIEEGDDEWRLKREVWAKFSDRPAWTTEVYFVKGRLKFGDAENGAPFPSMVVVFRRS